MFFPQENPLKIHCDYLPANHWEKNARSNFEGSTLWKFVNMKQLIIFPSGNQLLIGQKKNGQMSSEISVNNF